MNTKIIKIFISCPGDVDKEASIVKEVCKDLNVTYERQHNLKLETIYWKDDHAIAKRITGSRSQDFINEQLEKHDYDIYIGILGVRFGKKDPSTGFSPTEEEFEMALQKFKNDGYPYVYFFFRTADISFPSIDQIDELKKDLEFKDRLSERNIGLYDEFRTEEEFKNKIEIAIEHYIKEKILNANKCEITKTIPFEITKSLQEISYLMQRSLCKRAEKIKSSVFGDKGEPLKILVQNEKRIIVLGDAGTGKSVELEKLADEFSDDDSYYYPLYIKLNKIISGELTDNLLDDYKDIPEEQRLFILDGLDEVESQYRSNTRKCIQNIAANNISAVIVVSCRSNFYYVETDENSGSLSDFEEYTFTELDHQEFTAFAKSILGDKTEKFIAASVDKGFRDYLSIPFYLVNLVKIYEENSSFPKNKAEVIEEFISSRLNFDIKHFCDSQMGEDLRERKSEIIRLLSQLSLVMETLGRNYITKDEFESIIPDIKIRDLLHHGTLLETSNKGDHNETWQFEHNNFQEYLAAKRLSGENLEIILSFISDDEHNRLIPSWTNTINFLLLVRTGRDLFEWMLEKAPELVINAERDRLTDNQIITAFKRIFNTAKEKQIWIRDNNFTSRQLAQFGQSNEIIEFLIEQDTPNTHYTTLIEAISLLGEMCIPEKFQDNVLNMLIKHALDKEGGDSLRYRSLMALSHQKFFLTNKVLKKIITPLKDSEDPYIRAGLYAMINASQYIDDFIDIYLDGIQYIKYNYKSNRDNLVDERWHLWEGLSMTKGKGLKKFFSYLKENCNDFMQTFSYKDENIEIIIQNASDYYETDNTIFDDIYNLLAIRRRHYLHSIHLAPFFVNTGTVEKVIDKLFEQDKFNWDSITDIAALSNTETFKKICFEYPSDRINDDFIESFLSALKNQDKEKYKVFYQQINQNTDNHFYTEEIDQKEREKIQLQKDFDILFDKDGYLTEIKNIFEYADSDELSYDDFTDLTWKDENNLPRAILQRLGMLALHTEEKGCKNKRSREFVLQYYEKNWDYFSIKTIYNVLLSEDFHEVTEEQKDYIQKYYDSNITKVNFKIALTSNNQGQFSIARLEIILQFFLMKFNFHTDDEILFDMLYFDSLGQGASWAGIQYLETCLSFNAIKEKVVNNLLEEVSLNPIAFENHVDFCKRHELKMVIDIATQKLTERDFYKDARRTCLDAICELADDWISILEKSLADVSDDFQWNIIDKLIVSKSSICINHLIYIMNNSENENEQYKSVEKLLRVPHIEGLKKFTEIVTKQNKVPEKFHYSEYGFVFETLDALPFYVQLLQISYSESFQDYEFRTLHSKITNALVGLGAKSKENLKKVQQVLEEFIENNSTVKNINFLNICIQQMNDQFYMENSPAYTIQDVTEKISLLFDEGKNEKREIKKGVGGQNGP